MKNPIDKVPGIAKLPPPARWVILVGAVGGLGFVAYKYIAGRGAKNSTPVDGEAVDDYSGYPGDAGGAPITRDQPAGPDPENLQTIRTDADWTKEAVDAMYAVGYTDTGMVARVLGAYLANLELDSEGEATVVRTAIGLTGRPPSGEHPIRVKPAAPSNPTPTNPPQSTPTPTPAPPASAPAKPAGFTWKILPGQTLSSIADYLRSAKGYGGTWRDIYNENTAVLGKDPNKIKAGTTINIRNK